MASDPKSPHQATLCARAPVSAGSSSRPLVPSIDLSVVYCPADLDHVDALSEGTAAGFIYARDGHPNAAQLADSSSACRRRLQPIRPGVRVENRQ